MDLYLHQVVPVGYHAETHLSASYQEALGTIYLTLHPSLMTMTEALIHEFRTTSSTPSSSWTRCWKTPSGRCTPPRCAPTRGRCTACCWPSTPSSPWRRLYEAMIAAGPRGRAARTSQQRYARVRALNHEGAEVVLAHGRPTAIGRGVLDEIRHWDAYYPP